jgi:hypothetical protein
MAIILKKAVVFIKNWRKNKIGNKNQSEKNGFFNRYRLDDDRFYSAYRNSNKAGSSSSSAHTAICWTIEKW